MKDKTLPIGEVAHLFQIPVSTIRYWEECGLIEASSRQRGWRHFDDAALRRIALIQLWQRSGMMSLSDIRAILDPEEGPGWRETVTERVRSIDEQIERLHQASAFLTYVATCPQDNPARDCPKLAEMFQELVRDSRTSARGSP
jgi:DNA-binding transcriptional MerR regulator